jgi:beta-glucanase (GH16 family)
MQFMLDYLEDKSPLVASIGNGVSLGKDGYRMKRQFVNRMCMCLILLLSIVSGALAAPPAGNWTLVWSDEFNGTSLDTSKWGYGAKPWGTTDNSPCRITPEDTYLENGSLVLRSRMGNFDGFNFSSGWAWSKVWLAYGYLEIRAQYPAGKGQWPAWWMLREGWPPEIDIAEFRGATGTSTDYMTQAVYDEASQWRSNTIGGDYTGWHVYGFEWGPGYLKWYIDGSLKFTVTDSDIPTLPMYVILSAGLDSTADASTGFPNYYKIDYFRWYQTSTSSTFSGVYEIKNKKSGKLMDVTSGSTSDGALLEIYTDYNWTRQRWTITHVADGYYKIINYKSGKSVDVAGGSTADGAAVLQWTYSGQNNQLFRFDDVGGGYYRITPKHSGKCLGVSGGSTANTAKIIQWTWGSSDQYWQLNKQW